MWFSDYEEIGQVQLSTAHVTQWTPQISFQKRKKNPKTTYIFVCSRAQGNSRYGCGFMQTRPHLTSLSCDDGCGQMFTKLNLSPQIQGNDFCPPYRLFCRIRCKMFRQWLQLTLANNGPHILYRYRDKQTFACTVFGYGYDKVRIYVRAKSQHTECIFGK